MLPKEYRLRKNRDFRFVYGRGASCGSPFLSLVRVRSGPPDRLRVGFSVSKKVGNAVVRNRVKRRMREAFREVLPSIAGGHKLIFVARPQAAQAEYRELLRDMKKLLKRARLLQSAPKEMPR